MSEARRMNLLLILVAVFSSALEPHLASGLNRWKINCSGGNYTPTSGYAKNLQILATRLPREVSLTPLFFSITTVDYGNTKVYSVAYCRRDVNASLCKRCLDQAFRDSQVICPSKERVVALYDYCSLGLSNDNLTTTFSGEAFVIMEPQTKSTQNYSGVATVLVPAITDKTAESKRHFATGQQNLDEYGSKMFALAQCVPMLTSNGCRYCLKDLMDQVIFGGFQGGRISSLWCDYRWEMYQFFMGNPMIDIPIVKSKETGKGRRRRILIWSLVGVVVALLVVAASILILLRKRKLSRTNRIYSGSTSKFVQLVAHEPGEGGHNTICQAGCQSALARFQEILELAAGRNIALFLDYDGTISQIVNDPDTAYITEQMRDIVAQAANLFHTSIVSGRGRQKVQDFVQIDEIHYAGSHGLDIKMSAKKFASSTAGEINEEPSSFLPAAEYLPVMKVIRVLEQAVSQIQGATVEDNVFTASVHYRNVEEKNQPKVERLVKEILAEEEFNCLKLTTGQMVWEVRPRIKWNKGDAVEFLLGKLGLNNDQDVFPIFIGDDTTDKDAFKVLRKRKNGIGILVSEVNRETQAFYSVKNPSKVRQFLELLVRWKGGE